MKQQTILQTEMSVEELADYVSSKVKDILDGHMEGIVNSKMERRLSRKEARNYLGVSYPTLNRWEKAGILVPDRIGGKVYYSETLILSTIEKFE